MGYLEEFQAQISNRDFQKFLQLWEEYCTSDTVESEEFIQLLESIKGSEFVKLFGPFVETALPLWQTIKDEDGSYKVLRLLMDLEVTNSPVLAETALKVLQQKYGKDPHFNERIRLIGLRNKENFQGALSNYDLLAHMAKGKFVFHISGWGTGEIIDISTVREQVSIEFENVAGRKHLTFSNAFKTLIPLPDENFLARRFANPDRLEQEARDNPLEIVKILLRDLGPKSAAEIKDELCDLVIPEKDWTKWWQGARAKIKKDTMVDTPESLKESFKLRKSEVAHEERLLKAIQHKVLADEIILTSYNFVRDFPGMLKKEDVKKTIQDKLLGLLSYPDLSKAHELQLYIFMENQFGHQFKDKNVQKLIQNLDPVDSTINGIEIIAFKKRALMLIRSNRKDWQQIFLSLLFSVPQSTLREYIMNELNDKETRTLLISKLEALMQKPMMNPDVFYWYFQLLVGKDAEGLPFSDKEGLCKFFEAFLILFHWLESRPENRELSKKMYTLLSGKRYAVVRAIIEGTSLEFIKEFLLLVSKCQSLPDTDIKTLRSLAEVVHPSLIKNKPQRASAKQFDSQAIWTTEEGYLKTQDRIRHIGTVEIVENAREIEAARALGDLRENSEYKFAQERRHRLQGELKSLSEQYNRARVITKDDVLQDEAGIGSIVTVVDNKGAEIIYTILGPWDTDTDRNILSFQSKFVQAMVGHKLGEKFKFRDDEYEIVGLKTIFDK